ncbi:MAG TPA: carboxypeptidase regulatory-like domain-containing protein [Candidatus Sulfotelmatobacter sp.]|nr:carboxypeptidase regulatory-like domain-containing protein [Candidatus Sulfotelmatobacter sp.]
MRFPLAVCVFVCFVVISIPLVGQSPNGNINGLVSDASNAAVAGAEIVAVNDVTGVQYTTKTNSEGMYALPNLPPGPYRIQVSKIGFKTVIKPDIVLNVQDALSINFTIPVGAVFEVLTVQGGAPLVNTESAAVSTVVDETYVKNMPLNGRSFQDLILLTPGAVTQTPQLSNTGNGGLGETGEFSVNGQRTESNNYSVDGVSANIGAAAGVNMLVFAGASGSVAGSTALGTTQALVSVDDLQEFRVQSSSYAAEYGRNPGGQFAFETKSGANQWHGTAYDYLRNGALDAQDWFNDYFGTPEPGLRQNDFGGTLGGPVEVPRLYHGKDRTFFFVSYEGLRLIAPQPATPNYVPDAALRASALAAVQQFLNAFPLPSPNGIDDTANGIAQYIGSWSNPGSLDSASIRLDQAISDKARFFFRFSDTVSSSSARGTSAASTTPTVLSTATYTLRTYTAGVSSALSNHLGNEFRLNYSTNSTTQNQVIDALGGSTPINLAQVTGLSAESAPEVFLAYGGYSIALTQQQQFGAQRQWNLVDTVNLSRSRHQFKFGVDYRRLTPFAVPSNPTLVYFYFSESAVQTNSASTFPVSLAPAHPLYTNFSAFAQDEWRVLPRLSLSLGLRWELNPAPSVTQGLRPYALAGSNPDSWTLAPQGTALWRTTWYNFAPRLGIAYILHNTRGHETVIRGGGGVFFDTGQQLGSSGFNGPGFVAYGAFGPGSFPTLPVIPLIVNPPVGQQVEANVTKPDLELPYTIEWNASVEQALSNSQTLTFSYVGSHSSKLLQESSFNTPNNPIAGGFLLVENGLTSDYDSAQAQFRRRLNRGATALASYTWSHCIDYGSQNINIGYQRGNCDFDVRHNLSAAFSYDLPNLGQPTVLKLLAHNWGLDDRFSARTSFPVTLDGNELLQPNGQFYHSGLNFVPNQPVYLYGANCDSILQGLGDLAPGKGCPGGQALNPLAFSSVNSGLGNVPRNFARGFGAWQMDLAVRREFPIYERLKLQFRAEAFNVFNHPNFGNINPYTYQTTFGQATGTLASSLGILSPLYQMGGPRSMQFALKIIF